jgi:hypothetical protein
MLYNKNLKKIKTSADCLTCPNFDKKEKKCKGIGIVCFEYDPKTKTAIDPISKLPIKL